MTVSQRDLAEATGVSVPTVSLILSGRADELRIRPETARAVKQAAEALGYRAHYHARALSTGRSDTIGVLMGAGLDHRMWGQIAQGVAAAALEAGKDMLLLHADGEDARALNRSLEHLQSNRIDQLVLIGHPSPDKLDDSLRRRIVAIEPADQRRVRTVRFDAAPGIGQAVEHLAKLGHRHVLWLGKASGRRRMRPERYQAFRAAADGVGLKHKSLNVQAEPGYLPGAEDQIDHYLRELDRRLRFPKGATAMLCYNDTMALALYALCRTRRLEIPGDMSVIGFDDTHAALAIPAMTTISHQYHQLGRQSIQMLLNSETPDAHRTVPSRLVIRASTAKPGSLKEISR